LLYRINRLLSAYIYLDDSLRLFEAMNLKQNLENAAGKLCEILIPIKHEYYIGGGNSIAICILSSIDLLQTIAACSDIMHRILVAGRLLSENKGLDKMISFTLTHPDLHHIVVCGREVRGHKAGQALMCIHKNGVRSNDGRIIGATGRNPFLSCSQADIKVFRRQVTIHDLIGNDDLKTIKNMILHLCVQ
jgi:tetrahydromethanopterin S-methyltransferase subunit A